MRVLPAPRVFYRPNLSSKDRRTAPRQVLLRAGRPLPIAQCAESAGLPETRHLNRSPAGADSFRPSLNLTAPAPNREKAAATFVQFLLVLRQR